MELVGPIEKRAPMERNMDLIRALLLKIAADPSLDGTRYYILRPSDVPGEHSQEEVNYHIDQLFEARLIAGNPKSDLPQVSRLTWQGHEFVDNIRDDGVWRNVKERLKGLSSVAFAVIGHVAEAEVKKRLGL